MGSDIGVPDDSIDLLIITPTKKSHVALDPTTVFTFQVDVSGLTEDDDNGLCAVSIDAPVNAFTIGGNVKKAGSSYAGGDDDKTITWHIRGGTVNANPDGGPDMEVWDEELLEMLPGSRGGAVILAVGLYPPGP